MQDGILTICTLGKKLQTSIIKIVKIAFFGGLDEEKSNFYQQTLGSTHEIAIFNYCLGEQSPETFDFEVISIFVACKASRAVLEKFPNLKMIAVRSTGFDNVDTQYCKEKGIIVSTVPAYGSHTVAEYAFALLLNITRKLCEATERTKDGNFSHEGLRGFDLYGKTIGIIGTGKIGANAARIAKGFDMEVLAFDVYKNEELAEGVGFKYVELNELLERSDIVSLHAPATPETHHIINKESIFKMKKDAVLLNTARGALVETEAMFEAMKQNHLSAIGIDVLEEEKSLQEIEPETETTKYAKELIEMPNVFYSSHVAFYTKEAEHNIMETTRDNIEKFLSGTPQNNVIQ